MNVPGCHQSTASVHRTNASISFFITSGHTNWNLRPWSRSSLSCSTTMPPGPIAHPSSSTLLGQVTCLCVGFTGICIRDEFRFFNIHTIQQCRVGSLIRQVQVQVQVQGVHVSVPRRHSSSSSSSSVCNGTVWKQVHHAASHEASDHITKRSTDTWPCVKYMYACCPLHGIQLLICYAIIPDGDQQFIDHGHSCTTFGASGLKGLSGLRSQIQGSLPSQTGACPSYSQLPMCSWASSLPTCVRKWRDVLGFRQSLG